MRFHVQGHALGVGVCVTTADGKVVLQRRSAHVGEGAGLVDVPGGHPEPSVSTDVDVSVLSLALTSFWRGVTLGGFEVFL